MTRVRLESANKYGARVTRIGSETFDSKAEAEYWLLLLARQQRGEIASIQRQPHFVLQPSTKVRGKTVRAIEYTADFQVEYPDGRREVVDVKGHAARDFSIRVRLFKVKYPDLPLVVAQKDKHGGWVEKR